MDFISHIIFNIFPIHSLELIYLSSLFVSALVLTVSFSQLKTLAPLLHFCLLCPVCFDEGPWLPAAICRRVVIVHFFCRQGTLFFTMLLFYSSIFGLTCFFFHSFHLISFWYKQSLKVHFILNDMSLSKGLSHFVAGPELQSKFLQGQVMLILKKGSSCEHVWFQLFSFFQPLISRQNLSALF